ncbi:MAG: hypothetical protein OEM52_06900 [bacterium]|nr:hypothetical protein [bacterium]
MKKLSAYLILAIITLLVTGYIVTAQSASDMYIATKFTHKLHVEDNGMKCTDCHGKAVEVKPGVRMNPGHAQCIECHDVQEKNECAKCHTSAGIPSGFGKPASHLSFDWKQMHGTEAAMKVTECNVCHEPKSCDECHNGSKLTNSPHPVGFRFNHAVDAAFGGRCLSCHETKAKCTDCHRREIPVRHAMGTLWANRNNGGEHVEEARMAMESCLACHDQGKTEPACVRCHK